MTSKDLDEFCENWDSQSSPDKQIHLLDHYTMSHNKMLPIS